MKHLTTGASRQRTEATAQHSGRQKSRSPQRRWLLGIGSRRTANGRAARIDTGRSRGRMEHPVWTMRVLMVTSQLPTPERPGTMAPVARQIESVQDAGVDVEVLEITGLPRLKYLQAIPRLWRLSRGVDLIHAHYGYCGWLARLQWGKPIVVSFMGDDVLGTPDTAGRVSRISTVIVQTSRLLARIVDVVIVKSPEMAQRVRPARALVVPNGVDLQRFVPMPQHTAREHLGWDLHQRTILFPSSPNLPRKGYSLAQAAVRRAAAIMGEPLELVALWGVPPEQVPLYMNACDAMMMTSYLEGSPNAVKEAMACDLPVISVPVGDVADLLAGVERSAIRPRDADALGEALAETLRDGRRSTGRAALVDKGLDQASVARRLVALYNELLEQRVERWA